VEYTENITFIFVYVMVAWYSLLCFSWSRESPLWNPKAHYYVHKALHWNLSWSSLIYSETLRPASLTSILILSSHLGYAY
jgi:hypothetical protein